MASNSKKRRRVLGASCILAALIIASSSFAWFTSKDEVTNRLTASADYGVAIAEDFQPPENFLPGQKVNKDVGVVNTGNVDAFVRMWLGGQMRIVKETSTTDHKDALNGVPNSMTEVTDESKKGVGLSYYDSSTNLYYKTLSTDKVDNPLDSAHSTATNEETNNPATFSEVQSVQAGGVLVYAPANAAYHWTLEQATELPVYDSTAAIGKKVTMTNVAKGTVVGNSTTSATGATKLAPAAMTAGTDAVTDSNYYGAIDASTFTPETSGLYIFRRNVVDTTSGTANNYEYSGYYYDVTLGKYFALHTGTGENGKSENVLPTGSVTENNTAAPSLDQVLPVTVATDKVYLYTASETLKNTAALTWAYQDAKNEVKYTPYKHKTTGAYVYKSGDKYYNDPALTTEIMAGAPSDLSTAYDVEAEVTVPGTPARFVVSDGAGISMNIDLANVGTAQEEWTKIGTGSATTFYYNNDVEEGDTTTKLVDSVELSSTTTKDAYLTFDFDLDVFMESVQVTNDEDGKEKTTPVNTWAASTGNTGAKPSSGNDASTYTGTSEISVVGWTTL